MKGRAWHWFSAAIAAAFCSAVMPVAAQQLDQVFVAKSAPSRGRISAVGHDEVTLDVMGTPRPFAVQDIVRITYAEEPSELNAARTAVIQKNYNQALQDLRKLDGQKIERDLIRQDIEYFRALAQCRLAMGEGGDKAAATTAMVNFVKAAPQSYHFYEAAEVLGDLAMSSGKWADAARYYGPIAGAKSPDYQMRSNNAIGRALIGDKQFEQALAKFEAVLSSEHSTTEAARQKLLATAGKAVCLAETGKAETGVGLLQDVISKNDPQDIALFARTYNALGKCYLKLNQPKDAVLAFLHTDVLFYNDADAHAEALYHLSKLWIDVKKSDRAVAARNTLKERYAGSVWAALE
jgi:tetratricopeptide (TPR) repeat protein